MALGFKRAQGQSRCSRALANSGKGTDSPVRISQFRRAIRQVGCILHGFRSVLGGKSHSAVGVMLHSAGKASHALSRRALLACPPVQATASERLLCSVNHMDNTNSRSALVNCFLLTSAPFH